MNGTYRTENVVVYIDACFDNVNSNVTVVVCVSFPSMIMSPSTKTLCG